MTNDFHLPNGFCVSNGRVGAWFELLIAIRVYRSSWRSNQAIGDRRDEFSNGLLLVVAKYVRYSNP